MSCLVCKNTSFPDICQIFHEKSSFFNHFFAPGGQYNPLQAVTARSDFQSTAPFYIKINIRLY